MAVLVVGVMLLGHFLPGPTARPAQSGTPPITRSTAPPTATPTNTPTTSPTPTTTPSLPGMEVWQTACGEVVAIDATVRFGDQPTTLSPGPISLLLCDAGSHGLQRGAPSRPITAGLAEVVTAYNERPLQSSPGACQAMLGSTYALLFTYPDGHTERLFGATRGCAPVGVRVGASLVLAAVRRAFDAQQPVRPVGAEDEQPCGLPKSDWLVPDPAATVALYRCMFPQVAGQSATLQTIDDPATLDDLRTNLRPTGKNEMAGISDAPYYVALDSRGRVFQGQLLGTTMWSVVGDDVFTWRPSASSTRALTADCDAANPCRTPSAFSPGR